jgi:hypothetical protein
MTKPIASISPRVSLKRYIHLVREQSVMLDSDLAALYEVTTGNLNLAVRRNKTRFPADFMLTLTKAEADGLLLQNARANGGRGGRRTQPFVFTELGIAMLSSVLNSERAVQMNIEIMRAFVRLRRVAAQRKNLGARVEKLEQSHRRAASVIEVLAEDIDRIERNIDRLKALPAPRKRKIGFGA